MLVYRTAEEVNDRLADSVAFYGGNPVYIINAQGDYIWYKSLPYKADEDNHRALIRDPKWDASEFRLGFINLNPRTHYLSRFPVRRYTQGLAEMNIAIPPRFGMSFRELLQQQNFAHMLTNKYPRIDRAAEQVIESTTSLGLAFNKRLAWYKHVRNHEQGLLYRGEKIGTKLEIKPKGAYSVVLEPDRSYMKEYLEQFHIEVK